MSVINQFKLERLNAAGVSQVGIKFHWASTNKDSITFNNVSFSQPNTNASNNYISNLGGFKRIVGVDFNLFDDGTDKSTDGSGVITLAQQRDHLMSSTGIIQGAAAGESLSDVTFKLTVYEFGSTYEYIGVLEDFSLDKSADNGTILRGSLDLTIGTN